MNLLESWRSDVTYYNAVIMTQNHLRFATGRHVACKCLVNVYVFRVHVY